MPVYQDYEIRINLNELIEKRRWNLKLNNKLLVKLPDENIRQSLKNLKLLFEIAFDHAKSQDVTMCDLLPEEIDALKEVLL